MYVFIFGVLSVNEDEETADDEDDDEVLLVPISSTLESYSKNEEFSVRDIFLPEHQRCASHTLNLICTNDIKQVYTKNPNSSYSRLHHSALGKCSAIWNLTARSPKACEIYQKIAQRSPTSPCQTRWNSTFDCLENLLKVKDSLNNICIALDLPKFKEAEFEFLSEYLEMLRPFAEALDHLQGSKNTFYGELIPQLFRIKKVFKSYQSRHFKFCSSLANVLLENLQRRFQEYFDLSSTVNDAILASITHPFFKLRWVPKEHKDRLKQMLITEVEIRSKSRQKQNSQNRSEKELRAGDSKDMTSSYFLFEDSSDSSDSDAITVHNALQLQALQYLQNENTDLSILHQYPDIKELFKKYNTPLPSSAAVERLFSYAGMIMTPKRRCMTDENFEMLLLIKANATL